MKQRKNRHIKAAPDDYNNYQQRKLLETRLKKESCLISKESLRVLSEFEILME